MDNQVQRGSTFRVLLDLPYAKEAQIETNENTHEVTTLPDREITLLAAEDNDLRAASHAGNPMCQSYQW